MGNNSTSDSTNESSSSVLMNIGLDQNTINNINQQCSMASEGSNLVQIVGSSVNNLTVNQQNSLKGLCEMQQAITSSNDAHVVSDVLTKLSQAASSSAKAGLFGGASNSTSNNIQKAYTEMNTHLSQNQINNITSQCLLQQSLSNVVQIYGSSVSDSVIDQVGQNFLQCVNEVNATVQNSAVAEAGSTLVSDQTANSTATTGIDFMSSLASLSSLGAALFPGLIIVGLVVLCICCISCLSIFKKMSGGGGGAGDFIQHSLNSGQELFNNVQAQG